MQFTLFHSNSAENAKNAYYPTAAVVSSPDELAQVVTYDYTTSRFVDGHRKISNFESCDCVALDFDNTRLGQDRYITPEDLARALPEVSFAIHYSRNNMVAKGGEAPRPKFHAIFPLSLGVTDTMTHEKLVKAIDTAFPYSDDNAHDAARFFYGTHEPKVEWHEGSMTVDVYFMLFGYPEPKVADVGVGVGATTSAEPVPSTVSDAAVLAAFGMLPDASDMGHTPIPMGERNQTLSREAMRLLKLHGDTEDAYDAFLSRADDCVEPLDDSELKAIWSSAVGGYREKVLTDPNYMPPEVFKNIGCYIPKKDDDFSDLGEAKIAAERLGGTLAYNGAMDYLVYDGRRWNEDELGARRAMHDLIETQSDIAHRLLRRANELVELTGASEVLAACKGNRQKALGEAKDDKQRDALASLMAAEKYLKFVTQRKSGRSIGVVLGEVAPKVAVDSSAFDSNPLALCTPDGIIELEKGDRGLRDARPDDFCTHMTSVGLRDQSNSEAGRAMWAQCLESTFCGRKDLIEYVQQLCGLVVIGEVRQEGLIICHGEGANGKSTFWNAIAKVLGDYSGRIDPRVLTTNSRTNAKVEMADLRGKRLVIAAELPSGTRMDDGVIKAMTSTDVIRGERKYRDPIDFEPSHTLILYTNHRPRVGEVDNGTWRRLNIIPFEADFSREAGEVGENLTGVLVREAGGAILSWLAEGARKVLARKGPLVKPQCVVDAEAEYRGENDNISPFIEDCCTLGPDLYYNKTNLYNIYTTYMSASGIYPMKRNDFFAALVSMKITKNVGGIQKKTNGKNERVIYGLCVRSDVTITSDGVTYSDINGTKNRLN